MRLDLDMPISCLDGGSCELTDVVIDPRARRVTHLVVQPHHRSDQARLVPLEDTKVPRGSDHIALEGTLAELIRQEPIAASAYLRPGEIALGEADWDIGIQEMYALPEYGSLGPEALGAGMTIELDQHVVVSFHRVPKGSVELRRQSPVTSCDGDHLGHVIGFVVEDRGRIAHLVVEHGHLWGKRHVVVPGAAIARLQTDDVTLRLSNDAVSALSPVSG